jgi:divalent metal cation (Fe/Co/Zn/Cd) transporter
VRRAHLLNRITIGYNGVEGVVAVLAGVAAGSVSLIGFGLDSAVEVSTSLVLAWRLHQERRDGCRADDDRRATRAIAVCFAALALWVGYEALTQLVQREQPAVSIVGIVIAGLSVVLMPLLARAKKRLGPALGSQAVISEARQTELCAYLSGVVLLGLGANAVFGWWWADPIAALAIAGVAGYEAVHTWRADSLEDTCCA